MRGSKVGDEPIIIGTIVAPNGKINSYGKTKR